MKTYELRRTKKEFYRMNVLEPLVKTDASNATTGTVREYALPADFLMTDYCEYSTVATPSRYPARLDSFNDIMHNEQNSFLMATAAKPAYYIRATFIGFSPVPVTGSANCYIHYYYKQPITASSGNSGSAFSIGVAGHDAIVLIAFGLALKQDDRFQESAQQMELAFKIINNLA